MVAHLRLLALLTVLDIGLDLFFHPIPYMMLPKSIIHSLDTLMSSDRGIMKVCNKQLALLVHAISDVDCLNSYWIQEYLILVIVTRRYIMVQLPTKQICNMHLASFLINKLICKSRHPLLPACLSLAQVLSRPVLNRSFLGDLGVGVRSSIKTGVLHSGDRASRRLGRLTECLGVRPGSAVEDWDLIREDKGEGQTERRWVSILFDIRTN